MKRFLLILSAFAAITATAADILLSPGQSSSITATCISCPPPPPPVEIIKEVPVEVKVASPRPGNAHAVYHPDSVKKNGYANCITCHSPTSTTPAKVGVAGSFICSQYEFCTSGNIAGKTSCKIGVTVGGYATGDIPQCRDCHYPHATIKEPPKKSIHAGCLDCHKAIGNEDLKPGIKK